MCDLDYGYMGFTRNIIKIKGKTYQNFCTYKGEFINNTGNYKSVEELTNLKSNTTYTVEVDLKSDNVITNNNKSDIFRLDQYNIDENGSVGNGVTGTITSTYQTFKFTFTTVSNFKRAILILRNNFLNMGLDSNTMYAKNIKVIEGDHTNTDLPTEINGIESACENENNVLLLKGNSITLPQPLRSLPNGVCDEIKGNKLIQRVGKIIINGSENIVLDKNLTNTIIYSIKTENCIVQTENSTTQYPLCDKYRGIAQGLLWVNDIEGCSYCSNPGRGIRISILKSKLSDETVSAFINYISQNPITVYYELATPVETTINVNIKKIQKAKCYNKIKPTII